jgi:hypothetical protein
LLVEGRATADYRAAGRIGKRGVHRNREAGGHCERNRLDPEWTPSVMSLDEHIPEDLHQEKCIDITL